MEGGGREERVGGTRPQDGAGEACCSDCIPSVAVIRYTTTLILICMREWACGRVRA